MYMYSHKIGRNTECLNMPCLVCSKNIPSAQILDTTHNKHNVCYNNVLFAIKGFCSQQEPSVNHTKSELKILSFFHNAHIYLQTYRPANRTACIAAYNQPALSHVLLPFWLEFTCTMWRCALIRNWLVANVFEHVCTLEYQYLQSGHFEQPEGSCFEFCPISSIYTVYVPQCVV